MKKRVYQPIHIRKKKAREAAMLFPVPEMMADCWAACCYGCNA
ncbi:hypothetical protein [Mesopusillimonas faecipullorum]|nr:hypothetical protein [Mesopusillimonas faecipullorum]